MHQPFERLDLSSRRGRVLAIGDVHGCFSLLRQELDRLAYDPDRDALAFAGDMINRGPESGEIERWLHHPRTIGNHEAGLAALGDRALSHPHGDYAWLAQVRPDRRRALVRRMADAPVMLEIATPAGRRVGIVHATVPWMDWTLAAAALSDPSHPSHQAARKLAITDREHARDARGPGARRPVVGIDHVFLGHTPLKAPVTHGNCSFIDTGSHRSGRITVVDVDQWLSDRILP